MTRDEVQRLLDEAAQSAPSQWEPSDADALWMLHGRDLATDLHALLDRVEAVEAERDALRAQVGALVANGVSLHKAAAAERAAVVAWLREGCPGVRLYAEMVNPDTAADAIERGEHCEVSDA